MVKLRLMRVEVVEPFFFRRKYLDCTARSDNDPSLEGFVIAFYSYK